MLEGQTIQLPNEKGHKDKQRSTKTLTQKTKYRATGNATHGLLFVLFSNARRIDFRNNVKPNLPLRTNTYVLP
jgi:hypothetical protein